MISLLLSKDWRVFYNRLICDLVPTDSEHDAGDECACVPLRYTLQHYRDKDDIVNVWVHRPRNTQDLERQQSLRIAIRLLREYFSGIYHLIE